MDTHFAIYILYLRLARDRSNNRAMHILHAMAEECRTQLIWQWFIIYLPRLSKGGCRGRTPKMLDARPSCLRQLQRSKMLDKTITLMV
jgi:hypothetical protein